MTDNKEIYRSTPVKKKGPMQTALLLSGAVLFCAAVFIIARALPAGWFFQLAALAVTSLYINKILKQGTFSSTYILYADRLIILTRYGLIELQTGLFPLDGARFCDTFIEYKGKKTPFFPDDKLKKLLKIQITS